MVEGRGGGGEWELVPLLWDDPTELGRGVEVCRGPPPGTTAVRSLLVELGVDGRSLFTFRQTDNGQHILTAFNKNAVFRRLGRLNSLANYYNQACINEKH